ncbi:MAG: formylglycine-generating enzyme family protein [Tepidisphaerales bacterium]
MSSRFLCTTAMAAMLTLMLAVSLPGQGQQTMPAAAPAQITIQGSMFCNGACIPDPKPDDHLMVLYAIDGPPEIRARVARYLEVLYPERGLDADAAVNLMDQFTANLKFYIAPESPALRDAKAGQAKSHYCQPAQAVAVTGTVVEKDGRKWLTAAKIEPAKLKYPAKMLAADKPFAMPDKEPLVLRISDKLTLKCIAIPPGRFLMGTPFYMWPYYMEEYPHVVTLTRGYYLAEIPVTQEMFEAVMGGNPSTARGPHLPVQDPRFADIEKFCRVLSERNGRKVRLPTDAEWEYAARVGTSNPGFQEKYQDQNSSGPNGFKTTLEVKSRRPNAWGLYDMASCWWEITADKGMYNVRHADVDPHYPPAGADSAKVQRSGRGILKENWSIGTHEFITEKGYAGQKFRVLVEAGAAGGL